MKLLIGFIKIVIAILTFSIVAFLINLIFILCFGEGNQNNAILTLVKTLVEILLSYIIVSFFYKKLSKKIKVTNDLTQENLTEKTNNDLPKSSFISENLVNVPEQHTSSPEILSPENGKILTTLPNTPPIRFCRKCGNELAEYSTICNRCGTKVIIPDSFEKHD